MLMKAKALKGYNLLSLDAEIGNVKEFYFDDHHWTIRYLVAANGNWMFNKQVLISPYSLGDVVTDTQDIAVDLTKKQIENGPSIDTDKPVSRQFEESYYGYYGMPTYWTGANMWGSYSYIVRDNQKWNDFTRNKVSWDSHLRSTEEVTGYPIHALDGEIGHVDDFVIDVGTWAIRYLIVATQNWLPAKKVLISPEWIERVSWSAGQVYVGLSREAIKHSSEYTDKSLLTRDYEKDLYQHYGRPAYWSDGAVDHKNSY